MKLEITISATEKVVRDFRIIGCPHFEPVWAYYFLIDGKTRHSAYSAKDIRSFARGYTRFAIPVEKMTRAQAAEVLLASPLQVNQN